MRSAFEAESFERCVRSLRLTVAVGVAMMVLFLPTDFTLPTEFVSTAVAIRIAATGCLISFLAILHLPITVGSARLLGFSAIAVAALMILCMMAFSRWSESGYYPGLHTLILCSGFLATCVHWPRVVALIGALVCALYGVLSSEVIGQDGAKTIDNLLSLAAAGVLAVVVSAFRQRLHRSEFEARWSVAEAYRHKSEFFANVSHELRTPIHVMFGYIDMLLDGEETWSPDDMRSMLLRIRSQGMNLHKLVSDLLDSAKVEAGKMDVQWEPVRVSDVADQIVEGFRPLVEEKGLTLLLHKGDGVPEISSDERKLKQIITNLLGNALKFTERGSIRVEVERTDSLDREQLGSFVFLDGSEAHRSRASDLSEGVVVLVSDTGIGISRGELKDLARDYVQAGGGDAAKYGGTGLGLSLSRKLTELTGGRLGVRSAPGLGSTFAVFLPGRAIRSRDKRHLRAA